MAQTRPGGRILLPWANDYTGMLVSLTVDEHGTAHGRIVGDSSFGQRVPQCQWRFWPYDESEGAGVFWLLDFQSRSWAKLTHTTPDAGEDEFAVSQYGPRRLWDEVDTARQWWVDQGRPGVERWRFTVTPDGQQITLH